MHPLRRRTALSCAALAATLAVLTGCGGQDDAGRAPAGTAGGRPGAGPSASRGPMLPDSRITPATGSFTKEQKQYLSGRVPADTDPAAVLQLGQEACDRVAHTARHDRDAAVAAVIAGDIPGARDAIEPLCPDQLSVLRAARAGFPDGTRKGPAAGTYRALTPSASCSWRALGEGGKVLASGPELDSGSGPGKRITARVPAGTREFASSGCYAWVPA
ncbi:hypothetical protein [Streptomyces sp. TS71-3]|uniref:hypothetical protein n=1 Tax=Streptomyces sp. TS71-3 TaxID=2733862 RepID=UPI001B20B9F3|nr:hypothetical protein [Streptomyces sp. TS71-3]GHJ42036.1 hypothetical protein Sm713_76450 [Streptomyces sp. TS71-3]